MTGPEGNSKFCFPRISMFPETKSKLRGNGTLKYGVVHEKSNFSEMQELRPLRIVKNILKRSYQIFFKMSVKFEESTQGYKIFHVATPIATTVYYKNVTKNID